MALENCAHCGSKILFGAVEFNGRPYCPKCKTKAENLDNVQKARVAYKNALSQLAAAPTDAALYEKAVEIGRLYVAWTKHAQGQSGVVPFSEVALANEIQGACGLAAGQMPPKANTGFAEARLKDLAVSRGAVLVPKLADVRSGAEWAKWLGVARIASGGLSLVLFISNRNQEPRPDIAGLTFPLFQMATGALCIYFALRLLDERTRRLPQFAWLIAIFGVALGLQLFGWVLAAGESATPPSALFPVLTVVALWKLFKGRRQLKSYLAEQSRTTAVAEAGGTSTQDRLVRLQRLREQGLITEAEFTAKRAQVLAEL